MQNVYTSILTIKFLYKILKKLYMYYIINKVNLKLKIKKSI